MPKVSDWNGHRFHFFSNEGDPREPVHIHVTKDRDTARFWIKPDVALAYSKGFGAKVLSQLVSVIESRVEEIERTWNDDFG